MKKIRLLQVIPSMNSGGVERGTFDIAKGVCDLGHSSIVVSNGGSLVNLLKTTGSKHIKLPVHSKNPVIIFQNIKKLKKIIIENDINIIHTRSRAPAWSSYYASRNLIKSVSTFHNVYGHNNLFKRFYNSILGRSDSIIANSNFVKKQISKIYQIPEKKIKVIHRGIDVDNFNANNINEQSLMNFIQKYNIIRDKKIILYPGRLTSWKGQIEFLKVLKQIKDKNFFCIFAGDDKNESYTNKLINTIKRQNLGSYCKILGHVDDIRCLYKLSHLVVNASIRPEGFGRVVAESMSMEKPVIAYDHGGVSEQILIHNDLSVPFKDIDKMAKTINEILSMNQSSIEKIGKISRDFVLKNFTKKNMVDTTINFYKNLL